MAARDLNFTAYSHVELFEDDDHEVIESFHEHTKMSPKSCLDVGHRVSKIVADPNILAMMNRSWKVYPAARKHLLDKAAPLGDMSLQTALRERRSVGAFGARLLPTPMTQDQLSAMLMHSYGAIRELPWKAAHDNGGFGRPAASAGGLYPIEIYPVVLNVEGLTPGIYHYNVPEHALHCVREGDGSASLMDELKECTTYHDLLQDAAVVFLLTGVWKRTLSKYHQRGYRFMLHDAGTLVQNLYLTGTALDLGTCALGGMFDNRTAELLDTNPLEEPVLLGFVAGGRPAAWTPNGAKA
jgi:SagB-type dehydrogenase family enzyme